MNKSCIFLLFLLVEFSGMSDALWGTKPKQTSSSSTSAATAGDKSWRSDPSHSCYKAEQEKNRTLSASSYTQRRLDNACASQLKREKYQKQRAITSAERTKAMAERTYQKAQTYTQYKLQKLQRAQANLASKQQACDQANMALEEAKKQQAAADAAYQDLEAGLTAKYDAIDAAKDDAKQGK